jgi:branched-chain amino acid transport system substrate-binding protein
MKPFQYTRRALNMGALGVAAIAALAGGAAALADQKVVKIGITLPLTGADAEDATLIKNGFMIAFDEANAAGGVAGYTIVPVVYDNGTATAGQ